MDLDPTTMATSKDRSNTSTDSPSPFTTHDVSSEMPASDKLSASVNYATSLTPTTAAPIKNNAVTGAQLAAPVATPFSPFPCGQLFNNSHNTPGNATDSKHADTIDESDLGIGLFSMGHHKGYYESVISDTQKN